MYMDDSDTTSVSKSDEFNSNDDEAIEEHPGGRRPLFSAEDGEQIGGSFALPTWMFIGTRLMYSAFHFSLGTTVLVSANLLIGNQLSAYKWLYRLAGGVHVVMGISFLVLTVASFRYFRETRSTSSKESSTSLSPSSSTSPSLINYIASPIHHTAVALATTLSFMSTIYMYYCKSSKNSSGNGFGIVSRMVLNPLVGTAYSVAGTSSMLDFMLGARIRFRKEYIPLPPLVLFICFACIANKSFALPHALRFMEKHLMLWLIALHVLCIVNASVAVPLSYIGGCIEPKLSKYWNEYKQAIADQEKRESNTDKNCNEDDSVI